MLLIYGELLPDCEVIMELRTFYRLLGWKEKMEKAEAHIFGVGMLLIYCSLTRNIFLNHSTIKECAQHSD